MDKKRTLCVYPPTSPEDDRDTPDTDSDAMEPADNNDQILSPAR
jgi:hypothetical protein